MGDPLLPQLGNVGDTPAPSLSPSEQQEAAWSRWHDLPADIMGRVMRLLSRQDHVSLAAVCPDWRASVRRHWSRRIPAPAYLLLPSGKMFRYPEFMSCDVEGSEGYCGACEESLLFSQGGGVDGPRHRLISPFIRGGWPWLLPSLSRFIRESSLSQGRDDAKMTALRKMVMCSNNTIAAIVGSEYNARLAIYWPASHLWFLADDRWRWYEDLAFCDDRLHALTGAEDLWGFDVGNVNTGVGAAQLLIKGPPDCNMSASRYLVRSCASGALLMVRRQLEPPPPQHQEGRVSVFRADLGVRVSVFRADLASSRWVEVTDLGREALLVGRLCSRAVPARDDVEGNTILFATVGRVGLASLHGVSFYDMMDGAVTLRNVMLTRHPGTDFQGLATWLFPCFERIN